MIPSCAVVAVMALSRRLEAGPKSWGISRASPSDCESSPSLQPRFITSELGRMLLVEHFVEQVAYTDIIQSFCKDTVFDPVSLSCGHIFCYMCCCSAASVTTIDGLKAANPKAKCPLCRQEGVYVGAVHLDELNILLSRSCPDYWEKRIQTERVERVRQAKEHWESQCRAFMGT